MIGEHTDEVLTEFAATPSPAATDRQNRARRAGDFSKRGKPFALNGVRIIDLSWMLASGGAARYLSSLGAEVIKVEHSSRLDIYRTGSLAPQRWARGARTRATGPIKPTRTSINQSGAFMEVTPGRREPVAQLEAPAGNGDPQSV
jgi:hypothetical protein